LRLAERQLRLERQLPAMLLGEAKAADAAESHDLARMCQKHKRLYAAAARLYADAFRAEPKPADDLRAGHRYNAACSAAMAATGQGEDAAKLDDKDRAGLRRQAVDWLGADLAARTKLLGGGDPQARAAVRATMRHWQTDTDLTGVRHPWSLLRLPAE